MSLRASVRYFFVAIFLCFASSNLFAQGGDKSYRIKISDNRNLQNNSYDYIFKGDSLKIMGVSDYGTTSVIYYATRLKRKQIKAIRNYLFSFPVDSLKKEYFDDFTSFGYISSDHFPRVIEIDFRRGLKLDKTKITNCWVENINNLFEFLNQYIPQPEVKLIFKKEDFKKYY